MKALYPLFFSLMLILWSPLVLAKKSSCSRLLGSAPLFMSQISLNQLIPGQAEIGQHIVEEHKAIETQGLERLEVPVIAVVIKSGTYYILQDRHHTANGLALNKGEDFVADLNIVEKLVAPQMSDAQLMSRLAKEHKVYLGENKISKNWSFKEDWPQSIFHLSDNPMRSLVKLVFMDLKISGKDFVPFFQFFLSEMLEEAGVLSQEDENLYSEVQIRQVEQEIFKNPEIYSALVGMLKGKQKRTRKIKARLKKLRKKYLR